jgi:hypothetical protein
MIYQDKTLDMIVGFLRNAKLTDEARAMGFESPADVMVSILPPWAAAELRRRMREEGP